MTDYATNSTIMAASTIYALDNADTLYVATDATLISTASTAVTTDSNCAITVLGEVYGAVNGINLGDPANAPSGYSSLVVAPGGSVAGNQVAGAGVFMSNTGVSVVNDGTITGAFAIGTNGDFSYRARNGMISNGGDLIASEVGIFADTFTGWISNAGRILVGDGPARFIIDSPFHHANGGIIVTHGEALIENSGLISSTSGFGFGIAVDGGNSCIINSGEITSTTTFDPYGAVVMFTEAGQTGEFTNAASGRVTSLGTAVGGGDGVETVINRGEIIGNVMLGAGDDIFDGRTGVVVGVIGGDVGDDWIRGGGVANDIDGGRGDDRLAGNAGEDTIRGGRGRDILIGGSEADVFVYANVLDSQSGAANRDVIRDFIHREDAIDLSSIDANITIGGNQSFVFIGSAAFSAPGQVSYDDVTRIVSINTDSNLSADMQIKLAGNPVITAVDFIL